MFCNWIVFFVFPEKEIGFIFTPVRLTAFILCLLVLVLGCIPCADANACASDTQQTISQTTNQGHDHHDICSPFCICSCCAGFSFNQPFIEIETFLPQQGVDHDTYYIASLIEVSLPIWQPPRLS
ncbi:MAG TPA: DUF6660 family protein [Chitinophaga sp.]